MRINYQVVLALSSFLIGGIVAGCGAPVEEDDFVVEQAATLEEEALVDEPLGELEQPLRQSCGGLLSVPCPSGEVCEIGAECPPAFLGICSGTCVARPAENPCTLVFCGPGGVCVATGNVAHCLQSL